MFNFMPEPPPVVPDQTKVDYYFERLREFEDRAKQFYALCQPMQSNGMPLMLSHDFQREQYFESVSGNGINMIVNMLIQNGANSFRTTESQLTSEGKPQPQETEWSWTQATFQTYIDRMLGVSVKFYDDSGRMVDLSSITGFTAATTEAPSLATEQNL